MTELRFARAVYHGPSLDSALAVYARFATFERAEEADHWIVRVGCATPERERKVAGELANYAFGLTVKARGG